MKAIWPKLLACLLTGLAALASPLHDAVSRASASEVVIDGDYLASLVIRLRGETGATGVVVGIQSGDGPPLVLTAGTSLPDQAVTPDMQFRYGAPSITALTTVYLQLVDQGVLSHDMPLSTWFPGYLRAEDITLGMLASSRSGYQDFVHDEGFLDAFYDDVFRVWTTQELIDITFAMGMGSEPGTQFGYSHANFIILGEAMAEATGTSLRSLVETGVVAPLGLETIRYRDNAALTEPVLQAYTDEREIFENSTYWSPSWTSHTGFFTGDMADLLGLMRGLSSGRLLSEEGYATLLSPINVGDGRNTQDIHYGYGVLVRGPWITQSFSFGGYAGIVSYLAEQDLTIGVVTTRGTGETGDSSRTILTAVEEALLP